MELTSQDNSESTRVKDALVWKNHSEMKTGNSKTESFIIA